MLLLKLRMQRHFLRMSMKITNIMFTGVVFFGAFSVSASQSAITGDGIGNLVVGKPLPKQGGWHIIKRHWLYDENHSRFESVDIRVGQSLINAEIYDGAIWRLTVLKPGLSTLDSVTVGTSVRALDMSRYTLEVGAGPTSVLIPRNLCGLSYVLDTFREKKVQQDSAQVEKILVIGCSAN